MSKILNSQLLIYPTDFTKPDAGVNELHSNKYIKGEFAEKLLLYDRVIIPTFDFSIMPVLLAWLGTDILENLLDHNALSFIRHLGFFGYFGKDGLCIFEGKKSSSASSRASWVEAAFGDVGTAADFWIYHSKIKPEPKQIQRITDKVISHTCAIKLEGEGWDKAIKEETHKDILESSLSKFFPPNVQLNNLSEIESNQIKIVDLYGKRADPPEIALFLRLAYMNYELYLSHVAEEADLTSSFDIDLLLKAKIERCLKKENPQARAESILEAFSQILDLNRIVDIGSVVATGELSFDEIVKIRNRNNSEKFRNWFHLNVANNPEEARKEYVATLQNLSLINRLPIKALRFLIISAIGLYSPALGIASSFVDSFFLEKFAKGYTPKFFIDKLRVRLSRK